MKLVTARRAAFVLVLAALTACTNASNDRDASVLGTKYVSGSCPMTGGATVRPGLHRVSAVNEPLTLVVSGGRVSALAPAQQITPNQPVPPATQRVVELTLGLRDGGTPGTVLVTAKLRNATGCSIELSDGRVTLRPTEPAGAPATLNVRFSGSDRLLVPPGGEASGTATHTVTGDGSAEVSGTISAAVGVVR